MSDESVLCIKKELLNYPFNKEYFALNKDLQTLKEELSKCEYNWIKRKTAEKDSKYKQIIPYILISDINDRFFTYRRKGNEKRLHGLWSAGIGGHVSLDDKTEESKNILNIILNGAYRELNEETGINCKIQFKGIINEEKTNVGNVHLGLVFHCRIKDLEIIRTSPEVSNYKITGIEELNAMKLELWSELALRLIK